MKTGVKFTCSKVLVLTQPICPAYYPACACAVPSVLYRCLCCLCCPSCPILSLSVLPMLKVVASLWFCWLLRAEPLGYELLPRWY